MKPYTLKPHLCRFCKFYNAGDSKIPAELLNCKSEVPSLEGFPYPLPSKKSDYTCFAKTGDVEWYGASNGLTRYDKNAEREEDILMYFSAPGDLLDNNVKAIMPDGEKVWVLTDTGAAYIEMKLIGAEEKADILFLGNSYYAFSIDPEVRAFIRSLDKDKVGRIVNFGSAAMLNSTYKKVKAEADKAGIPMDEREFHCKGEFKGIHKGRPNEEDMKAAAEFAGKIVR
jgi:hypothetical protein